jgi:hypothetical protein
LSVVQTSAPFLQGHRVLEDEIDEGFNLWLVALARRLAIILHAMWRTGTPFEDRVAI